MARLDKLTEVVDRLAGNIERLEVAAYQTNTAIDKVGARIDKLAEAIERQNAAIDGHLAVAQQQSANIAELSKLVTAVITKLVA